MTISIILPCLNEEENIAVVVGETAAWMRQAQLDGEIIVVNDGSTDHSAVVLSDLQKKLPQLRVVTNKKRSGYGLAVRAGCDAATMDLIAFMDSDGQFKPEDLSLLLAHLDAADFVTGRRRRRADPFIRRAFGKVLGIMNFCFFGLWIRDVNCGLKVFKRSLWPQIRPTRSVEKLFNTEMFIRMKRQGIKWLQIDVPHYPRLHGTPTGGSVSVIFVMFRELWDLKRGL